MNVVFAWFVELPLLRPQDKVFTQRLCQPLFSGQTLFPCCCSSFPVLEHFYLLSYFLFLFLNATVRLSPFQVLAVTPQPAKLFCSRFTTEMDIILSNLLSIKERTKQSTGVPLMDPLLVIVQDMHMISTYRTILPSTNLPILIPGVALHTLYLPDIQLVTVGFLLEPYISLLLTSRCSTK